MWRCGLDNTEGCILLQVLVRMMLRPINPTDLMLSRGW
jgi:hypothetical protein